jgi:hypothetical protein
MVSANSRPGFERLRGDMRFREADGEEEVCAFTCVLPQFENGVARQPAV